MSTTNQPEFIELPIRKVKHTPGFGYKVLQKVDGVWLTVSKDYAHSTSAFAALGRLVQKDTKQIIGE